MERRGARKVIAVDLHDPAQLDWARLAKERLRDARRKRPRAQQAPRLRSRTALSGHPCGGKNWPSMSYHLSWWGSSTSLSSEACCFTRVIQWQHLHQCAACCKASCCRSTRSRRYSPRCTQTNRRPSSTGWNLSRRGPGARPLQKLAHEPQSRSASGVSVKLVIRCSSATRAEISSRVKRATRSVPNSSTL